MNQWQPDERVRREDFNEDNRLIDAALSHVGNCRVVVGEYVGTGGNEKTLTFDGRPEMVILNASGISVCFRGRIMSPVLYGSPSSSMVGGLYTSWGDDWIYWSDDYGRINAEGSVYHYIAFLT